mmetsp:Transcript_8804/g.21075  ORF Transcript_8804/g.21075 Transcript_8804/m.21075 type:complete len:156 (-) Transcript_8804:481-948(-)
MRVYKDTVTRAVHPVKQPRPKLNEPSNSIPRRLLHPAKALLLIRTVLEGINTAHIEMHNAKASFSIVLSPCRNWTSVSFSQPLKLQYEIVSTLEGTEIRANETQLQKASSPKVFRPSRSSTISSELHHANAPLPITSTVDGKETRFKDSHPEKAM